VLIVSAATPINMKNWTVEMGLLETTVTSWAIFTLFLLLSSTVEALLMLPVELL
jgi:hypothetical protein